MEDIKSIEEFAHYVAALAQRAILYEVSTTPKPGLVDRDNSGSHKDMDFFTFMASSSVLYKGLYYCVKEGINFEERDSTKLLDKIRKPGIQCERAMFQATNEVNTHKGIIFSLGILCAVIGKLYKEYGKEIFQIEDICNEVKDTAKGLTVKDFKNVSNKKLLTHGERLFKEYGYTGIRGEVESGFVTVRNKAVGVMRFWRDNKDVSKNDMFLEVLLNLMAESEDTNVVIRGGVEGLEYVQLTSKQFLESGGIRQPKAKESLESMNEAFIIRNISPGGSADLLAVSIFLGMIEGIIY